VIEMKLSQRIYDLSPRGAESRIQSREFGRFAPRMPGIAVLEPPHSFEPVAEPAAMAIPAPVKPPAAAAWCAPVREFTRSGDALPAWNGSWLRTTGIEGNGTGLRHNATHGGAEADVSAEQPRVIDAAKHVPASSPAGAEPSSMREEVESPLKTPAEAPGAQPRPEGGDIPEAITVPARFSVRVVTPAQASPVQPAASFAVPDPNVQIPQREPAPLRPVMVLEEPKQNDAGARGIESAPRDPKPGDAATGANAHPPAKASRLLKIFSACIGIGILGIVIAVMPRKTAATGTRVAISNPADWIENYGLGGGRRLSLYRPSVSAANYRLEFTGAIQIKALGWAYRIQDPLNFYATKIELVKAGVDPEFGIAHYAVVNGVEQSRGESALNMRILTGAPYEIRFEAINDRFVTWIGNQKVDEWTDSRWKSGAAGLLREGVEQASLMSAFRLTPLRVQ
jgi:hypothetical protein